MVMTKTVLSLDIEGVELFKRGKVREVYDLGDKLLFVVTDRISAFDVIMANGIPEKGRVLNNISAFWFDFMKDVIESHMITTDIDEIISAEPKLESCREELEGRTMLVKKAEPIDVECIVRGYISGSGWKDYQKTSAICGIKLPEGLKQSDKLPEVIFTPSTKAESGHDINISQEEAREKLGNETFRFLKDTSIAIYEKARDYAASKGIIIADTKFEFGRVEDKIILMDEALTPDSSRFWPADEYSPGGPQKSFDKQFLRDYLLSLDWDKSPPAPELPREIIEKTRGKYLEALRRLTS